MSIEYYVRLERGNATGVSEASSTASAAPCSSTRPSTRTSTTWSAPRTRAADPSSVARPPGPQQVRPGVQQLLDAMTTVPVFVQNGRLDVVATNRLGRRSSREMYVAAATPANAARFLFLDPRAPEPSTATGRTRRQQTVALLRAEAGRAPYDRILTDLVGELSTRSDEFRTLWASHDVREHRTGIKRVHHPVVGDLDLHFEAMEPSSDRGVLFLAYTAEPGSASHDGLQLLANWAATDEHVALT